MTKDEKDALIFGKIHGIYTLLLLIRGLMTLR